MSTRHVVVPLAPGFEEIEAVTIADTLRRAGVEVTLAGLEPGPVTGSHGITVQPDATLDTVRAEELDMAVLPGGMPGAANLRDHRGVQELLRAMAAAGRWCAAICAGPIALGAAGVCAGRSVTSFPGFADQIPAGSYLEDRVVVDGPVITSRGPGTALEFALVLVEKLEGSQAAADLQQRMLVERSGSVREIPA